MTRQAETTDDGTGCDEQEYNCEGNLNGCISGTIKMRCDCDCPEPVMYIDKFHTFSPNTQREDIQPAMLVVLGAAVGAQFGSLLDLGHVGWLLHYRVPAP